MHPPRRALRPARCDYDRNGAWSGSPAPFLEHVLHPLSLLERLRGIAVELNPDRPLPRRDESQLRGVRPDGCPFPESGVRTGAFERVGEDAALARLDRLSGLTIAHRHRVDDVLASMWRDRIGCDVEQVGLAPLPDLRAARRPTVGTRDERADRSDEERTARREHHDW